MLPAVRHDTVPEYAIQQDSDAGFTGGSPGAATEQKVWCVEGLFLVPENPIQVIERGNDVSVDQV